MGRSILQRMRTAPPPQGHEEEGYFFTWTKNEIEAALNAEQAAAVLAYYRVSEGGNFEGRSILNTPRPIGKVAEELGLELSVLQSRLEEARAILYQIRGERPPPLRDEKILTAWNGMMISAFARGGPCAERTSCTWLEQRPPPASS